MINVLVVYQAELNCSFVATILRDEPDIHVVEYATTVDDVLPVLDKCHVLLVEATLPNDGALSLIKTATKSHPHVHVLVTGVERTSEAILRYIEAGASGYVLQEVAVEELIEHIRAVYYNKAIVSPDIAAALIARIAELADLCADGDSLLNEISELTPREREVLTLVSEGYSNQEISDCLKIEVGTVKNHVHSVLRKLKVESRREAAKLFNRSQVSE